MTAELTLDVAVRRELLRVAMRNAARSVPLQLGAVVVVVAIGLFGGARYAAYSAGCIGVVVAISRLAIARAFESKAHPTEADISFSTRCMEANAALAGLLWTVCSFGIYPYLQGTLTTAYMAIAIGSVVSAVLFMPLIGRSFLLLVLLSLGSMVLVSLGISSVRSYPVASLVALFLLTVTKAGNEIAAMTRLAVRHNLEKDTINTSLLKAKEAADAASLAKSQFLAMMSHEIRTPMNGVLGSLELLRHSSLDAAQRNLVKAAASSGTALLSILNDVLDHSTIEAGKLNLVDAPMSIHRMVTSVIALFKANALGKGLWLNLELHADVEDLVIGDAQRIKQILLNLTGNAIKFTARGGVTLSVTPLRAMGERAGFAFDVRDTGPGIAADSIPTLFQPFHQLTVGDKRLGGGTGLGLTISQRIAEVMGSEILVESEVGRGSRFTFELWLRRDTAKDRPVIPDSSLGALDESDALSGDVLVVEDDDVNRMIARETLLSLGVTVHEAINGADAVRMSSARPFDLIIMDCMMPVMNGYEAAAAIRQGEADSGAPRTPIVALTANAYEEDVVRSRAAGMDSHLSKPYTRAQIQDALRTWL